MNKKNNFTKYVVISIVLLCLQIPIASTADFEIINTNYTVDETKSDETKQYYTIIVTMRNTKKTTFENMTVKILDEYNIPTSITESFNAQESKTFTFNDIPFAGGNTHQVTVEFHPENVSKKTSANQGSKTFNISYNPGATRETPFFHPLLLIFILSILTIISKKKKQL